jgi:8-oxo-dGTP diphosphatase
MRTASRRSVIPPDRRPTEGLFGRHSNSSDYDLTSHVFRFLGALAVNHHSLVAAMTTIDDLWYLATRAEQEAEQVSHRLTEAHEGFLERSHSRRVSRPRFRTLAERIAEFGAPYGAHSVVYRPSGELLLVWHSGVDMWVVPGGEPDPGESFREAAERELAEEAGVSANFDGLGLNVRVDLRCDDYSMWGVLPLFEARTEGHSTPEPADPDGEITEAAWFDDLPENTRDREDLQAWREFALG